MNLGPCRATLIGLALQALAGCVASPGAPGPGRAEPSVAIAGILIENGLSYGVTDVVVEVPATGAFAGCGNLMPRTSCSNRFQGVGYRGNPVVIRWKERGAPQQTPEFVVESGGLAAGDYVVRVVIFGPGQAGAELVPVPESGFNPR